MSSRAYVRAERLTYGYRRRAPVLSDLSLAVSDAAMTAITGPSGRGKSTLMYLMAGLATPQAGSVWHGEQEISSMRDHARARQRAVSVGFVFQDFVLDPRRTLLDAVLEPALYAGHRKEDLTSRALDLMERFGVAQRPGALPLEMSGGQCQRVALCRALLLEPRVIFADEPTGNLDAESAGLVLDALAGAAAAGTTVVVVTHDDRVVARCDEVVSL